MAFRRREEAPHIELLPLIDVIFLLLVFFIVANSIAITKEQERTVEVPRDEFVRKLPISESSSPISKEAPDLLIQIERDTLTGNPLFFLVPHGTTVQAVKQSNPNGDSFNMVLSEIRNLGESARESAVKPTIEIRADSQIPYGILVRIMAVCKGTEREPLFPSITFAVKRKE